MDERPVFWSDQIAFGIAHKFPDRDTYVCASGITPSGRVHVGNFREIITTDFVVKSLQHRGEQTRFIYSWDDYDRFRKVPKKVPDEWEQYIGLPVAAVPDPWDCHDSYAAHFEAQLEEELQDFHMDVEFIRQSKMYQQSTYADLIRKALRNRDMIREILDQYRSEPLEDTWFPLRVYCNDCGKDNTTITDYDEDYTATYTCNDCGEERAVNFKEQDSVKLPWRVDWPMRWAYENVAFEPGGKDHSAAGSSRDTGTQIVEKVFDQEPPVYQMYDFVSLKGLKGKMSSSSGDTVTLTDLQEVYTPEMIRFLFSETKPKKEFDIAFDETIIQRYNKFDSVEDAYFNSETVDNEKKHRHLRRVYELAMVDIPDEQPVRPPFDHLAMLAQTRPREEWETAAIDSLKKTGHVPDQLSDTQMQQVLTRMEHAAAWAENHAPEKYRYKIQDSISGEIKDQLSEEQASAMKKLGAALREQSFSDSDELDDILFSLKDEFELETSAFFEAAYLCLLERAKGPRLSRFIMGIGEETAAQILESL